VSLTHLRELRLPQIVESRRRDSLPRAIKMASPNENAASAEAWFMDDENLSVSSEDVLRDGFIPAEVAAGLWRSWVGTHGNNGGDRRVALVKMAVSCSAGTSAETNFEERFLDDGNAKTCIARFVDSMSEDKFMRLRRNKLRVWARSMPGFALLTRRVIMRNNWLARQRAAEYEADVSVSGVCFDYSDVLEVEDIQLTPTESMIIKYGLRYKAREGRSTIYSGEGGGVPGSKPSDRGVAENIIPDASRMLGSSGRGGSGPYSR